MAKKLQEVVTSIQKKVDSRKDQNLLAKLVQAAGPNPGDEATYFSSIEEVRLELDMAYLLACKELDDHISELIELMKKEKKDV